MVRDLIKVNLERETQQYGLNRATPDYYVGNEQ